MTRCYDDYDDNAWYSAEHQKEVIEEDFEPQATVPVFHGHPENPPVNSHSVLGGYENLMGSINRVNRTLPEAERFHVPFGVQEALVRYIEERQTIERLTGVRSDPE